MLQKKLALKREDLKPLKDRCALGCSYPVGSDHILISLDLLSNVFSAQKISIGAHGVTYLANTTFPQPRLAVSDHCPPAATIRF